ncbi:MAG: TonB-dependent receptor family protein [Bacteroidaceae bacterium]|nr:TonB-dependent receptor family protein [Bacteroidaceae bacterium]
MKQVVCMMVACASCALGAQASDNDSVSVAKFESLQEIVVKGDLPNTRLKGNAMVTRIEGTALEKSGTLEEMLVMVPGMTGGKDGLEVLGKGAPVIYINGRMMRDASELKHLRSEEVRDVEVINNPGAAYDATVKAVVRIRTRKQAGEGFGFNAALADEQDLRYNFNTPNGKVAMNYRMHNVDVFGSVWAWHQDYRQYSTLEEESYTGKVFHQNGPYTMTWKKDGVTYTAGTNWQISDNHSVGARVDVSSEMNAENRVIYDEDIHVDGVFMDHLYSEQVSKPTKPLGWLTNAYYNGKVGSLGIDLNVDYMKADDKTDRVNTERGLNATDIIKSGSSAESDLYATKLILSYPVWKGEVEVGTEMSFVRRHTAYNVDKANIADSDADIKEDNVAAFVEYSCDLGNIGEATVGVRYEHNVFDYADHIGTGSFRRPMDNVFPSASFATQLGKVQMGVSYGTKTYRPSYFAMNDAVTYISRYLLQAGSATLKNEMLHEFTLNASWKWLTFTGSYERSIDGITQWTFLGEDNVVLCKHINLDKPINELSAYLGMTPRIGFWSCNATVGMAKQYLTLDVEDVRAEGGYRTLKHNDPVFTANMFNTFNLGHNWRADVNFMFRSKGHSQNFYDDYNNCRLGVVLQKSFLRDNALTLRAAVVDILQRNHRNEYCDTGYDKTQQNNRFSTHKFNFTCTYRFNTVRSKYKGSGAGKDMQDRMKG